LKYRRRGNVVKGCIIVVEVERGLLWCASHVIEQVTERMKKQPWVPCKSTLTDFMNQKRPAYEHSSGKDSVLFMDAR